MVREIRQASAEVPAWQAWHDDDAEIRLGVSSCLLGQEVRFDGGHKHDRYLTGILGRWVEWVPVCPELEIGLGVPRPTIRLEASGDDVRLVEPGAGNDLTEPMRRFSQAKIAELQRDDLDGYVLKGVAVVRHGEGPVYGAGGVPSRDGVGEYARILMERWPELPVEEEGRLNDPRLRENFIERIFCRNRWRTLQNAGLTRRRLIEFHTAHKLLLRSHNEAGYQRLGRLVAEAGRIPDDELFSGYGAEFASTLAWKTTAKRHANVLYHVLGYLKKVLTPGEKREMVRLIEDYQAELVPLIVPVTLLRHHVHRHQVQYMLGQLYLEPHPKELMLRNRV